MTIKRIVLALKIMNNAVSRRDDVKLFPIDAFYIGERESKSI